MGLHKNLSSNNIHTPIRFSYVNESSRLSATNFTEEHQYCMCVQESDMTFWILINYLPIIWKQCG